MSPSRVTQVPINRNRHLTDRTPRPASQTEAGQVEARFAEPGPAGHLCGALDLRIRTSSPPLRGWYWPTSCHYSVRTAPSSVRAERVSHQGHRHVPGWHLAGEEVRKRF